MSDIWAWVIAVPIAYLLGSIPTGVLVGRLVKGVDVRRYGSGSSGATNVMRTLGPKAAAVVLVLDALKGAVAVLIALLLSDSPILHSTAGVLAISGHIFPIFAGFHGGKGVLTGLGALLVISPIAGGVAAVGFIIAYATKYVSVGSLLGAFMGLATLGLLIVLDQVHVAHAIFAVGALTLIGFRHSANILRLLRGRENRLEADPRPRRARTPRRPRTRQT